VRSTYQKEVSPKCYKFSPFRKLVPLPLTVLLVYWPFPSSTNVHSLFTVSHILKKTWRDCLSEFVTLVLFQFSYCKKISWEASTFTLLIRLKHEWRPALLKMIQNSLEAYMSIYIYEGWNFNSGKYLFTTDTK